MTSELKPASKVPVLPVRLWFHLPVVVNSKTDLPADGWVEEDPEFDFSLNTYFHPSVAGAVTNGSRSFRRFVKQSCADVRWSAVRAGHPRCFQGVLKYLEYRENRVAQRDGEDGAPRLGMFTVALELDGVAVFAGNVPTVEEEREPAVLTLADAQNAIDWFRRIFPRWWYDGTDTTGDTLSRVRWGDGTWSEPLKKEGFQPKSASEPVTLLPWVEQLLHPIKLDGADTDHFGEERALVCSEIALDVPHVGGSLVGCRAAVNAIRDGDWFRLAEADKAGADDYPYSHEFLETLRGGYFYDRHAPSADGKTGNATRIVIAGNHLCMVGAGDYYEKYVRGNMEHLYRHMQFLCAFEYFRLLQFSKRLTGAVLERRAGDISNDVFREELRSIRLEFLDHTHLHHFSNVSSQLQPREMYSRIYKGMGLQSMHADLEDELRIAADYAASCQAQEQSRNAARINELVNLGVPLTLIAGLLGMNVLVGHHWPFDTAIKEEDLSLVHHIHQIAMISFAVILGWYLVSRNLFPNPEQTATTKGRIWTVWAAFTVGLVAFVSAFGVYS